MQTAELYDNKQESLQAQNSFIIIKKAKLRTVLYAENSVAKFIVPGWGILSILA